MSIQEQLVEDMKDLILSNPENLIKFLDEMSIENVIKCEFELKRAFKKKRIDMEIYRFCQINGYTSQIIGNDINVGENILIVTHEMDVDVGYIAFVSLIVIQEKDSDTSYKCKTLINNDLQLPLELKYIDFNNLIDFEYHLTFHDNSLGLWCGAEYDNICTCRKIKCFRKPN